MLTFSTLTASDANKINNIVKEFEPYSDFNFISLYSWSLHSQTKFSINNGGLFLILPDYVTHQPTYTFIGSGDVVGNFNKYCEWLKSNSYPLKFSLLPEPMITEIVKYLQQNGVFFQLYEERDSFDYVLNSSDLSSANGKQYEDLRYKTSLFNRTYGGKIKEFSFIPGRKEHQLLAIRLAELWAKRKADKNVVYEDEIDAFNRFLQISQNNPRLHFKAYADGSELIALASYEVVSGKYALGHFLKFDYKYKGIYSKLVREICTDLEQMGIPHINIEQDLGIAGLRAAKLKLKPAHFLKKYTLEIID